MKNSEPIEVLRELKKELNDMFGIEEIAVFGSVARGDNTQSSDIDIVILKMKVKNGFITARAKRFLEEKLNRKVDIGQLSSLNPFIKKIVLKEMIVV